MNVYNCIFWTWNLYLIWFPTLTLGSQMYYVGEITQAQTVVKNSWFSTESNFCFRNVPEILQHTVALTVRVEPHALMGLSMYNRYVPFPFLFILRPSPKPAAYLPQTPPSSKPTQGSKGRKREGESLCYTPGWEQKITMVLSGLIRDKGIHFPSVWTAEAGPLLSPVCFPGDRGWILIPGSQRGLLREDFQEQIGEHSLMTIYCLLYFWRNTSEKFWFYFLSLLIFFSPSEWESWVI